MDQQEELVQQPNPRESANIFSVAFFWWLNPLLGKGYRKSLEIEDLHETLTKDESQLLGDQLEREWVREVEAARLAQPEKGGGQRRPSLLRALLRLFGPYYAFLGLFTFLEECVLRIFQPLFMGWMMEYFAVGSTMSQTEAYLHATGVVVMAALYTFTHHAYFFGVMHTGMRMRVAACSLLYRKSLKLSNSALGQTTVGQMVNLLSNDVNRFDQSVLFFHYLWAGPLQLIIITGLLWRQLGPSSLTGSILLVLFVPVQTWVGNQIGSLRVQTAEKTDVRIRLMNEIVNGIKVIKMYTWEAAFSNLVHDVRKKEIDVIRKTSYFRSFNFSFFFTASRFILLCTFLVFGLTGEVLTAEKAFLALSLYNTVRLSMTLFFPFAISMLGECRASVDRVQDFLLLEERDAHPLTRTFHPKNPETTVTLSSISGKWKAEEPEETLSNISLSIRPGQLVAIIGPVGSGKSSVIQAILGELPLSGGQVDIFGDISYSPQEPWVFSGTVRQNILFGKAYDAEHYARVVQACALEDDFVQWPHGDRTLVGERGMALSGGQKARVTLARAVYRPADCYLLDDPLSAVDAHVGKHLFEKCIRGFLSDSAVILVTHQLQYLEQADLIVVLKQGQVQETGNFQHLVKNGLDFSAFLSHGDEDHHQAASEDEEESQEASRLPEIKSLELLRRRIRTRTLSITSDVSQRSAMREEMEPPTATDPQQDGENGDADEDHQRQEKQLQEHPSVDKEAKSEGSVDPKLYWTYFKSGGNAFAVVFMITVNLLCQVLYSGSDIWISYWTKMEEDRLILLAEDVHDEDEFSLMESGGLPSPIIQSSNEILPPPPPNSSSADFSFRPEEQQADLSEHYVSLGIYAAIVLCLVVTSMVRTVYFFVLCMRSSVNLHNAMFRRIIRAPCRFFDTNPVGRILNRFSKDMGSMDEQLPPAFFDAFTIMLNIAGIMAVIFAVRPWIMIPTLLLGVVFLLLRRFYMRSARDIKRLEGVARSPVFSQLSTSLQGLTSIRAFSAQNMLRVEFDRHQDIHSSAWFAFLSATRWFGVWLDWIVAVYLALVVYSFLVIGGDIVGGEVGLAISSCITLTGMLQWGVRQSAEVENLMTSVERVLEYSSLAQEAPPTTSPGGPVPPAGWPRDGVVEFRDVCLRYDQDQPAVLKGLTFKTGRHEKVGIVGRTGAGKSSLVAALFRLAEPTGSILVDGVEALQLGLLDLRAKLSIIPQDPLLFTGTLRRNLDPFEEHGDEQVWAVLQEVHLDQAVKDLRLGLDTEMSEGGTNFSLGQRQLICLARAILKENSILVLDEATANVDPRTDQLIQEQIRTRFKNCTVLTIAHRLHTIMDSDRVLVLSDGKVVEFDTPFKLLEQEGGGVFAELVAQTGDSSKERLTEMARQAHLAAQQRSAGPEDVSLSL